MKKVVSIFLAVLMIAALSVPAYAVVAPDYGTVKVNSRWNDQSIKQVTVSDWDYKDNSGIEFNGSFKVIFPKGYTKVTPTAAEAWTLFQNSMKYVGGNYDITYRYDGNGNGNLIYNGYNYVSVGEGNGDYICTGPDLYTYVGYKSTSTYTTTAAQKEAVSHLQVVRQSAEPNGWAVEWWASTSVAATDTRAWYGCEASQLTGGQVTTYRFSVLTEKVNGGWKTSFKTYEGGREYSSQTPLEVQDMLAKASATKTLPPNIVSAATIKAATDAYIQQLESRGYIVTATNRGTSDTVLSLGWYGHSKTYSMRLTVESRGSNSYRCHLTDLSGAHVYTVKEILTSSFA